MYYTYAYLREDKTPYYIGRGKHHSGYKYQRMFLSFKIAISREKNNYNLAAKKSCTTYFRKTRISTSVSSEAQKKHKYLLNYQYFLDYRILMQICVCVRGSHALRKHCVCKDIEWKLTKIDVTYRGKIIKE